MSSVSPRRVAFALAACVGLCWAAAGSPALAAQEGADEAPKEPAETVVADPGFGAPAAPVGPRNRRKAITETAWYLFFVTAGALALLMAVAWGVGWYKRSFLEESPLQTELFDAAARAEIEKHRKEVQAEQEAAKRAAGADDAAGEPSPDSAPGPANESPRETLAEQTAPPPDPAVQRDADAL